MGRPACRKKGSPHDDGFTLIEVLVAMVVLSLAIVGFMALQYQSIYGRVFAKRMSEAMLAGDTHAEEVITGDFDQLSEGEETRYVKDGGNDADASDFQEGKAHELEAAVYDWVRVTDNPNSELTRLKTLSMEVEWQEKVSMRSMRLHTVLRGGRCGDSGGGG